MKYWKFTWEEEFGWDDWRSMEWVTKAKNKHDAWIAFYDRYGILEYYIEYYTEINCDDDSLFNDEGDLIQTDAEILAGVTLKELEHCLQCMIEGEHSQYIFAGLSITSM